MEKVGGFFYYQLSFGYIGPTVDMPGDDEESRKASLALHKVIKKVETRAKLAGLEIRSSYAWPDGSLYEYVRTTKEISHEDFEKIFTGDGIFGVRTYPENHPQTLGTGGDFQTIEERFANLTNKERFALCEKRMAEKDAIFAEWYGTECKNCVSEQGRCKDCIELYRAAEKAQDEWRAKKRPFIKEDQ